MYMILFIYFYSEEDVIRHAAAQINTTKTSEVCHEITRLKLWKHKKTGIPVNPLKITFLGEPVKINK